MYLGVELLGHTLTVSIFEELPDCFQSGYTICMPAAHTCNLSYLGGCNCEDLGLRLAQANGSSDPISKITRAK
jgi:hypothetical protein